MGLGIEKLLVWLGFGGGFVGRDFGVSKGSWVLV